MLLSHRRRVRLDRLPILVSQSGLPLLCQLLFFVFCNSDLIAVSTALDVLLLLSHVLHYLRLLPLQLLVSSPFL